MKNRHENTRGSKHGAAGGESGDLKPLESERAPELEPIPGREATPADAERAADDMCAEEQAMNSTDLMRRLDEAVAQAEKNKDLYMRTLADLDTYRRKVQREKQELAKFAVQPLVEELIPSVDHLEMAIAAARDSDDAKNLLKGVEMVCSQIKRGSRELRRRGNRGRGRGFRPEFSGMRRPRPERHRAGKQGHKGDAFGLQDSRQARPSGERGGLERKGRKVGLWPRISTKFWALKRRRRPRK